MPPDGAAGNRHGFPYRVCPERLDRNWTVRREDSAIRRPDRFW